MYKVLVVDDDPGICAVLIDALSRKGFGAESALNGAEGLIKFTEGHFDVVVTDACMPDGDGNTLARYIRASHNSDIPIIGISGTSWLFEENRFDLVLQKPFSIHRLIDAIQVFMAGRMRNERLPRLPGLSA